MTSSKPPIDATDAPGPIPDAVAAVLRSAEHDEPSAADLASLSARLGPLLAAPPSGAPGSIAPPRHAAAAGLLRALRVAPLLVAAAGGGYWFRAYTHPDAPPARTAALTARAEPAPPPPARETATETTTESATDGGNVESTSTLADDGRTEPSLGVVPDRPRRPVGRTAAVATVTATDAGAPAVPPAADPSAEEPLLNQAAQALRAGEYAGALALTERHAREFPRGVLAEERERIAIEALARAGRRDEARARADALRARLPGSSYLRRIDAVLRSVDAAP